MGSLTRLRHLAPFLAAVTALGVSTPAFAKTISAFDLDLALPLTCNTFAGSNTPAPSSFDGEHRLLAVNARGKKISTPNHSGWKYPILVGSITLRELDEGLLSQQEQWAKYPQRNRPWHQSIPNALDSLTHVGFRKEIVAVIHKYRAFNPRTKGWVIQVPDFSYTHDGNSVFVEHTNFEVVFFYEESRRSLRAYADDRMGVSINEAEVRAAKTFTILQMDGRTIRRAIGFVKVERDPGHTRRNVATLLTDMLLGKGNGVFRDAASETETVGWKAEQLCAVKDMYSKD